MMENLKPVKFVPVMLNFISRRNIYILQEDRYVLNDEHKYVNYNYSDTNLSKAYT